MVRDINQAKEVIKYLEGRYGKTKNYTISDAISTVKDISDEHSLEEIKMMKKIIKASISFTRDMSYTNNHPISFLLAFFTAICTSIVALVTIGSQLLISYMGQIVQISEKKVTQDNLIKMVESMDIGGLMSIAFKYIVLFFVLIYLGVYLINITIKKRPKKLYNYEVLLEEACEKKKKDLQMQFKRTKSL